jgi:CRP-like cAMP-binding protein
MAGFAVLRQYLEARASFTEAQFAWLEPHFLPRSLAAGDFLQRAGDVATHAAFITGGCLRSYVIDAKGKEHIVQFAPETWWLADNKSLASRTPSQYFYEAVEPSELLLCTPSAHLEIVANCPPYAEAFQKGLQKHNAAKDQRIVSALSTSAEERYLEFVETYPSLVQRVPQFMLASYLGISPETLSRIRKNLSRHQNQSRR